MAAVTFGAMILTAVLCAKANWQKTKKNVSAQVDHALAESDRAKTMENVSTRLSKYLSAQLFEEILTGRQTDAITSKRKKLTVFFSDIVGFTELTDSLESEELAALLNRYLTEMTHIAEEHGGTVDKFISDAVVIYFGDTHSNGAKQDAEACVRMALAMKERVHSLKQEWMDLGLLNGFDLRIGINTGYCNVGNFGSNQRVDYTLISNEVNLAARLETAAGSGEVLLSGKTYALVKDVVTAKERAPLNVKGFARPVQTYQVETIESPKGAETQTFHVDEPNLTLNLNPAHLSQSDRDRYADILRNALGKLDQSTSQNKTNETPDPPLK
ncbi:MAG: adenylate/guanylate cyclase domain-containing protein [Aliishimia sp.]